MSNTPESTTPPDSNSTIGSGVQPVAAFQTLEQVFAQPNVPLPQQPVELKYQRRFWLPVCLFVVTCFTIFLAGATGWQNHFVGSLPWEQIWGNSDSIWSGLQYLGCLMAILLAHELGHFFMTVRYGIPASYPIFLPLPTLFTGTMGAVIAMDAGRATRRQMFDIGIAGPLAGMVVILPVLCYGILNGEVRSIEPGSTLIGDPLLVELLQRWLRPDINAQQSLLINPWYMAGWVGCLVTGINMFPMSQLDGGHVLYCLLRKNGNYVARAILFACLTWMIVTDSFDWLLMLFLIIMLGVDHPPTANDRETLGWPRAVLGILSLTLPVLCFIPKPF